MKLAGIPNAVRSRLREWLRETPAGTRSPTIDKSSGTQTFEKGRIQKAENIKKSDKKYREENYRDHKARENKRKKNRVPNYRRSQKNHYVYHVYKENDTKVQSYIEAGKIVQNSWHPKDEFFSSSPLLVLPRIQPKNGEDILRLRNSKTTTDRNQFVTPYRDNRKAWESNNWQRDSRGFLQKRILNVKNNGKEELGQIEIVQSNVSSEKISLNLRLDIKAAEIQVEQYGNNSIDNFEFKKRINEKIFNVDKNNNENQEFYRYNENQMKNDIYEKRDQEERDNQNEKLNETIDNKNNRSTTIKENELDESGTKIIDEEMKSDMETKILDKTDENFIEKQLSGYENIAEENTSTNQRLDSPNFPVMSSLTHNKMNDLLNSLRERINTLKQEDKTIGQFGRKMREIHMETEAHEKSRYLSGNCQDKSSSLANYTIPICSGARASFAERIQEIWIDRKAHWYSMNEKNPEIFTEKEKNVSKNEIEKKLDEEFRRNEIFETENEEPGKRLIKSVLTATERNFKALKPSICHVGVQYEIGEFEKPEKSFFSEFNMDKKRQSLIEIQNDRFSDIPRIISTRVDEKKLFIVRKNDAKMKEDSSSKEPGIDAAEFADKKNPVSSFSFKNLSSKIRSSKFGSLLNFWERKKGNFFMLKIRLKSSSNLRASIFRTRKIKMKNHRFDAKNCFSMRKKGRLKIDEKNSTSKRYEKFARPLKNIFSCVKKKSTTNVSENFEKIEISNEASSGEFEIDKNDKKLCHEGWKHADFSASPIEPRDNISNVKSSKKIDSANKNDESMTKLSVTTSNSTNITLQLPGSTSDTRNVSSNDSRLDSVPCLVESRAEIVNTVSAADFEKKFDILHFLSEEEKTSAESDESLEISRENNKLSNSIIDCRKKNEESVPRVARKFSSKRTTGKLKKNFSSLRSRGELEKKSRQMSRRVCSKAINETLSKRVISSKTSSSRAENELRLQRCKSVIDMKVDNLSPEQSKKVDVLPNEQQIGRSKYSSRLNIPIRRMEIKNNVKIGRTTSSSKRPKRSIETNKSYESREKSSLIPIPVGRAKNVGKKKSYNSRKSWLNPPSLIDILEDDNKERFSSLNSSRSRTILKKSRTIILGRESKKNPKNRVRFEFDDIFSDESIPKIKMRMTETMEEEDWSDWKKKSSGFHAKLEDWKIEKKIQSSLETGAPLKTITITEPRVIGQKIDPRLVTFETINCLDLPDEKTVLNSRKKLTACQSHDQGNKKKIGNRSYRKKSSLDRGILSRTLEKRNSDKIAISHLQSLEKKQSFYQTNTMSDEKEILRKKNYTNFSIIDNFEKIERSLIVDLTKIKEKLDNDIIERTSRTSGTEDNDCAIILIKAINSSMQLSDD